MNMSEIFRFELWYRLRRPSTYVYLAVYVLLAFMISTGMMIEEAQRAGDIMANGPAMIAVSHVIAGMMGLLVTAALFSDAALRDVQTRMHPLFAAAPISNLSYLGGRFGGALLINVLLAAVVPLTMALMLTESFIPSELLGPFQGGAFLQPYLYLLVPNIIVAGALFFAVAIWTRRTLPVFAFGALYFFAGIVVEEVLAETLGLGTLAVILEHSGFTALSELWEFWTIHEKNTQLVGLPTLLIWNRLTWVGLAAGVMAVTAARFRLEHHQLRSRGRTESADAGTSASEPRLVAPQVSPAFDTGARVQQMFAVARSAVSDLMLSRDFLFIAVALVAMVLLMAPSMTSDSFGVPSWPVAQYLAPFMGSFFIALCVTLLIVFYAGELVWREREEQISEISDANPVPDWVPFAGNFLALATMIVVLQATLVAGAFMLKAIAGFFRFEPGVYLQISFGIQLVDYLLLAVLALMIHVLVNNKYFGHLVVVISYLFTVFIARLGLEQGMFSQMFEHKLLVYGSDPGWTYSDISGFGPFLQPVLWLKLYWSGWALLFAIVASLFWVRGRERGVRNRLKLARRRVSGSVIAGAAVALTVIAAAGGYVYYNTNILNDYRTGFEATERSAEYERRYGQYEGIPQPVVYSTALNIEIYPEKRVVEIDGTYRLRNDSAEPITDVHLFLSPIVENRSVSFDRASDTQLYDTELGHRIESLDTPLQPGEALEMTFNVVYDQKGFTNSGINSSVVGNGTYFDHTGGRSPNHRRWLPLIGYQPNRELTRAASRKAHGLPPRPLAADATDRLALDSVAGRETINLEAVIGTSPDQIAVAPGVLQKTWSENGRRYFHYETERPIKNAFAIFSAEYEVRESEWNGVKVEIFHHPDHDFNVERIENALHASLEYFSEEFGPYPYSQLRVVEFPRYGSFAHAYPGTVSYAEGMGWLTKMDDESRFDMPTAIMAHEVAHQWWGQQIVPAMVEGAATITEVLAQYSALMVIEEMYGQEMAGQFLYDKRIEYLNRRGKPDHPEVPLLDVTYHQNLVYRKGPLVMYALKEYIGEDAVNKALRRFLEKHGSLGDSPTSKDLYRELQAVTPERLQYLLVDLFEQNTIWSFRTTAATAEESGEGWKVEMDLHAQKLRAGELGKETEVPMSGDLVEIVVWGEDEDGDELPEPVYQKMHEIQSGQQQVVVEVPRKPTRAGIDPSGRLIDRNWSDNTRKVVMNDRVGRASRAM